ncbi:hypothetical protein MNBD_GAMMA22-154 [hydrothermal vent metagenome]|uniref:Outer membrane protein OmpA-like transmembrane domain-containing protein n=1 Tax=hydrothermal vent metagenome TaxID=652676 RepID=A0A3B1B691_9ZZZZ
MKKLLFIAFIYASFLSSVNAAEAYIGASIGDSNISVNNDNKPVGYKLFLGTHVNDNVGIELGIINLGEFKTGNLTNKVTGTELSAVGFIPVGADGDVFAKLGLFVWNIDSTLGSLSGTSDGTDITIGFGFQYPIKDNILIRLEYQEFRDIDDTNDNFTFLSVGLALQF